MGGKNKKVTVGYHYHVAYHHGLSATPIDAFLEFRCADKPAWSGELTASRTLHIDAPDLFGGEKDQGGIVGDVDVMFGEPTQQPNAYLATTFGDQQPGWLGVTTLAFKGGRFGANNPYPQRPAYKIRVVKKGWDEDPGDGSKCWYPEKAEVPIALATTLPIDAPGWDYQVVPFQSNPGRTNLTIPPTGWLTGGQGPFTDSLVAPYTNNWPARTILWIRRTVTITGSNQVVHLAAENGCVLFVNGALVGASNPDNAVIDRNDLYPVEFPVSAGQTYTLVGKLYPEENPADDGGNYGSVSITAAGLIGMNPAHILYDALTSQDRGAEPIGSINDASFRSAADWFYSQGFGLCTEFDPDSETVEQFIARIEKVAGCSVSRSPVDGDWYLDIANGVYDLESLPILTDDDILEFSESPSTLDDAINSISVEYVDVQRKLTATTPPAQALALVTTNGVHHDVHQYHEVPTADLASRLAQRDLQADVTPTRAFGVTTTRKPFAWRINTYFRLQTPKRGIADMVCLLAEKSSGTLKSGAITLTAAQNVYSVPTTSFVTVELGVDTRPPSTPVAIAQQIAFEAPWIIVASALSAADRDALASDASYLLAAAKAPGDYREYDLATSVDGGSNYADVASGPFCAIAQVIEGDTLSGAVPATTFTLANGVDLGSVEVGSAALWDSEFVRVDAIDPSASPPTLMLGRGCADAVPVPHDANTVIWFVDGHMAADPTQYTDGETVTAKLLTRSGSQQLDASLAAPLAVTFAGRLALPYPPAKVRIGGAPYPSTVSGSIVVTWVRRDRDLQADQLVDSEGADIAPAADVRYHLAFYDASNTLLVEKADVDGKTATAVLAYTGTVTMVLSAINDAGESLQANRITFGYAPPAGTSTSSITASTWTPTEIIFVAGGA